MKVKPDLVLDIAGVLATNFSPSFWRYLSTIYGVRYEELLEFRKGIREELWKGRIAEQEFWSGLKSQLPNMDIEPARCKLLSIIKPLPAIEKIPIWSEYADIHLLSNHRREWIEHLINPVQDYIKSMTISAEVGYCKPEIDIYLKTQFYLKDNGKVLFVDDQEKNFKGAIHLCWNTLLADEEGEWIKKVSSLLTQ
ncbi:hypothetical protein MUB24_16165 [Lederbergia sp. NSJ-179]|uniref:hypothetical protein n=1 Tax=Lederbergia sp. NSJ-179 TaxID=2931402 RepID=UPI001FD4964A|nr:hypothetical protein [Lederbergia sp. NSJ-179]MCJ7842404.1 hypothetical protein [Lederbergia sp. NSJ-179]